MERKFAAHGKSESLAVGSADRHSFREETYEWHTEGKDPCGINEFCLPIGHFLAITTNGGSGTREEFRVIRLTKDILEMERLSWPGTARLALPRSSTKS